MVDMTGISITEEEHRLDELMTTLAPAMEAVEARNKTSAQIWRSGWRTLIWRG